MSTSANKSIRILILGFLAAGVCACANASDQKAEPVSVKVQKICFTTDSHPQVFIGHIEAGKSSLLSASYPGRLTLLKVRKGDRARQGDTLATIDSPSVKSLYETASATFQQAKDALDRVNQVYSTGSVSEVKLLDIQTSYTKAEAALTAARRALDDCTIKAPYDGVIGEIMVEEGVELGIAEPMIRFLDIRTVEVHASIPEKDYSKFSTGQKAVIKVEAVGDSTSAVLTSKGYEASPLSHSYDFTFQPYRTGRMMPGMVCKVYMTPKGGSASTAVVPAGAVRVDADGRYVWCIDSCGTVQKKHITVSSFVSDGVVVESGLAENDMVVTQGGRRISTGMKNIRIDECR